MFFFFNNTNYRNGTKSRCSLNTKHDLDFISGGEEKGKGGSFRWFNMEILWNNFGGSIHCCHLCKGQRL